MVDLNDGKFSDEQQRFMNDWELVPSSPPNEVGGPIFFRKLDEGVMYPPILLKKMLTEMVDADGWRMFININVRLLGWVSLFVPSACRKFFFGSIFAHFYYTHLTNSI